MSVNSLRKVTDVELNIIRKKYGRGFQYFFTDGEKIQCKDEIQRFRKIVIPPMWQDVRICEIANGHIQATGFDLKKRKQYIYHDMWHQQRQQQKFARIIEFARRLPSIRRTCIAQLETKGWSRDKMLSLMVLILDETGIRIGNRRYSESNKTYGLTTLRRRHVSTQDQSLLLQYKGKSHQKREVDIDDPTLVKLINQCSEQPGYSLFRFQDDDKKWHDIDSDDVNEYIEAVAGEQFSSKDFRTWVGTRLAYELYPQCLQILARSPRKKAVPTLVKLVAEQLGNTPDICKQYYIHPVLLDAVEKQTLQVDSKATFDDLPLQDPSLSDSEKAVLQLLSAS